MKKFGKFMVFTSIAAAGAAAVLYLKKKFVDDPVEREMFSMRIRRTRRAPTATARRRRR